MKNLKSPLASFRDLLPSSWGKSGTTKPLTTDGKQGNRVKGGGLNLAVFLNAAILSLSLAESGTASSYTDMPVVQSSTATLPAKTWGTAVHVSVIDTLGESARLIIGKHGLERLRRFEGLKAGWDGSGSKPLQRASVALFDRFVSETGIRPSGASVFMSSYGELILAWQDEEQCTTELKFRAGDVEYSCEIQDTLSIVKPAGFTNLAEALGVPRQPQGAMQLTLDLSNLSFTSTDLMPYSFMMNGKQYWQSLKHVQVERLASTSSMMRGPVFTATTSS